MVCSRSLGGEMFKVVARETYDLDTDELTLQEPMDDDANYAEEGEK